MSVWQVTLPIYLFPPVQHLETILGVGVGDNAIYSSFSNKALHINYLVHFLHFYDLFYKFVLHDLC